MAVITPPHSHFDPEWRYAFAAPSAVHGEPEVHVVFSGQVRFGAADGTSDIHPTRNTVRLVVGPFWGRSGVASVVPHVSIQHYVNRNSDEDDQQAWATSALVWDTVPGGAGAPTGARRIRLEFEVEVLGENSNIYSISYYAFAKGKELSPLGISEPQPAHPNG